MKKILALSWADARNIFREPILYFMLVGSPVILLLVAHLLFPYIETLYPVVRDYYPLLVMVMILQIVAGIGFVIASILLDERDEGVLTALRVLPLATNTFVAYRLILATTMSFCYAWIIWEFSGLVDLPWWMDCTLALLMASFAPIVVLAMASFSENKVEGLALFKGLNLLLLLPVIHFFAVGPWTQVLAIFPLYWIYEFLMWPEANFTIAYSAGIAFLLQLLWGIFLFRLFKRRVFQR